jgi:hypothetical protein
VVSCERRRPSTSRLTVSTTKEESMTDDLGLLQLHTHEAENGDLIIEWDETDPRAIELGINDWSVEQWVDMLRDACERVGVTCDEVSQLAATKPTEDR